MPAAQHGEDDIYIYIERERERKGRRDKHKEKWQTDGLRGICVWLIITGMSSFLFFGTFSKNNILVSIWWNISSN